MPSWHDETFLIEQEADGIEKQLTGVCMLAVHEVADEDEEDDEDVEMHGRRQEEVVGQEQEGLGTVPVLDAGNNAGSVYSVLIVEGFLEADDAAKRGHGGGGGDGGLAIP